VKGVRFVTSNVTSLKESRLLATTDGALIQQTFIRVSPNVTVTAVASTTPIHRPAAVPSARRAGAGNMSPTSRCRSGAIQYANEAVAKLSATPVEAGTWDLVLHPSHLWLTIHESVAHPSELDRALGYEANYAGTDVSRAAGTGTRQVPPRQRADDVCRQSYRSGRMCDRRLDDEGIAASSYPIVDKGLFVSYQSATREMIDLVSPISTLKKAPGHAYGQDWASIPFPRMPNVSLQPAARNISEEEVIAATNRGIYIEGDGSYSIDQQRYNFQFGGQTFWEIRNGKKVRQLRDVAYVARTPDFWNSMSMIGGRQTYQLGGALSDAKGQPSQLNSVSHGCPVALFRNVNVIRTA